MEVLGVSSRVSLRGPVPRSQVPQLLAGADALVNNMRVGAPDKVVYEAAATCLPVFASNPIFDDLRPTSSGSHAGMSIRLPSDFATLVTRPSTHRASAP